MKNKNKILLSSLVSSVVLSLTACGGGGSDDTVQHPEPDLFAPVISLNGADMVVIEEGEIYVDTGATATDNVDPSVEVSTSGFIDSNTAGTYSLTYSATDVANNTATKTRTIKVIRDQAFNDYNGVWRIECQVAENSSLEALGVNYLAKIITINGRNIKLRVRGYANESSCFDNSVAAYNGVATGRVVYTGKQISGTYTGEKVDLALEAAKYKINNGAYVTVSENNMAAFSDVLGLPFYDILTLKNANELLGGKQTSANDGSSNDKRPEEFDVETIYEKLN